MNLRPPQAAQHLGIGLTKFWDLAKKDPDFPTLTKLGARTTIVSMEALWAAAGSVDTDLSFLGFLELYRTGLLPVQWTPT